MVSQVYARYNARAAAGAPGVWTSLVRIGSIGTQERSLNRNALEKKSIVESAILACDCCSSHQFMRTLAAALALTPRANNLRRRPVTRPRPPHQPPPPPRRRSRRSQPLAAYISRSASALSRNMAAPSLVGALDQAGPDQTPRPLLPSTGTASSLQPPQEGARIAGGAGAGSPRHIIARRGEAFFVFSQAI